MEIEEKAKQETTEMSAMLQRLESIEKLLTEQQVLNRKAAKHRTLMSLLMGGLVAVLALGLLWVNTTFANATKELPVLIKSANETSEQLRITMEDISTIDFEAMNKTLTEMESGLGRMDFDALNKSIVDLQQVVERLRRFTDIFG